MPHVATASDLAALKLPDGSLFANGSGVGVVVFVLASGDPGVLARHLGLLVPSVARTACEIVVVGEADSAICRHHGVAVGGDAHDAASLLELHALLRATVEDAQIVVLLSDHLSVRPGWLGAIEEVFTRFEDAGAACGLLLAPGGRVVSAGARLDGEGALQAIGTGLAPNDIMIAHVARVPAAAPGFVAVRGQRWRDLSGNLLAEDPLGTGLGRIALLLAQIGHSTYCQPYARFTLIEPLSVQPKPGSWAGALQRWQLRQSFEVQFLWGKPPVARRRRVLLVDAFTPKPDQDSGSADTFWYMRMFQMLGYEVGFIAAFEASQTARYVHDLRRWGIRVQWAVDLYDLQRLAIAELQDCDAIMLFRVGVAGHLIDTARRVAPKVRIIFHTVDLHFLREERAALHERSASALDASAETRRRELRVIAMADASIILSSVEHALIQRLLPDANAHLIPIPRPPAPEGGGFASRSGVMFVGGFAHLPNCDAVIFLVNQVWPRVRDRLPQATLHIVGSNAPPEVLALAAPGAGVEVLGYVEELTPIFQQVRVSVAPLRYGAGIKGKVVSSMLHGVPCVATRLAGEGMNVQDGKDILFADDETALADAIITLHENEVLWERLSREGRRTAASEYSVDNVLTRLQMLLNSIDLPKWSAATPPTG
jgi:glycosyltransferase involved in cell wall biosynthesis